MPLPEPITPDDLLALVEDISVKVERIDERAVGTPDHDVVLIVKTFLRGILQQAKAVAWLSDSGVSETSFSNLRSLFETYIDLRYVLAEDRVTRAHLVAMYAMRQMLNTIPAAERPTQLLQRAIHHLAEIDEHAGEDFRTVKNRRTWAGRSRKAMMKAFPDSADLERQYTGLSWYAHGIVAPILAYDWSAGGKRRAQDRTVAGPEATVGRCLDAKRLVLAAWAVVVGSGLA